MPAFSPFIVVTGNIAAGKSTLVERLAAKLRIRAYTERVHDNPFFAEPPQNALESEVWFLADSVAASRSIEQGGSGGVQERSAYEHISIFAQARSMFGWLSQDQLSLLQTLADLLLEDLPAPDLLVYTEADLAAIRQRVAARGRTSERAIDPAYLSVLAEMYDEFVEGWTLSPVYRLDTTRVDVREDEGFRIAWQDIEEMLS